MSNNNNEQKINERLNLSFEAKKKKLRKMESKSDRM